MVRLTLVLGLLAAPAGAACFGPPMPNKVLFDARETVEILSHTATDLTYRSTLPDGSTALMTTRDGLFPVLSSSHGTTYSYDWITALPDLTLLTPGFARDYQADLAIEHASRNFFQIGLKVLRTEGMQVGGCEYRVIVMERTDTLNGQTQGHSTLWFSPALKFALRVDTDAAGKLQSHRVVGLE